MKEGVRLSQVLGFVENVISTSFKSPFWLNCELSEVKVNSRGHCFVQLVEKDNDSDKIVAKSSGIIWATSYTSLERKFSEATGQSIGPGVKVLLRVQVDFKALHGLNFQIQDIDPSYTLGEIERRRRETIARLKKEGLLERNSTMEKPWCFQNIAVISSEHAAGYQDFVDQVVRNRYGFSCKITLFQALLQGENAEASILEALDNISNHTEEFDGLVIIRGGGSQIDLSVFDSYSISKIIALWPVPVITGIGHTRDISVVDQVVAIPMKTPTAVADYIIERMLIVYEKLNLAAHRFSVRIKKVLEKEHQLQQRLSYNLRHTLLEERGRRRDKQYKLFQSFQLKTTDILRRNDRQLDHLNIGIRSAAKHNIINKDHAISRFRHQLSTFCKIDLLKKEEEWKTFYKTLNSLVDNSINSNKTKLGYWEQIVRSYDPHKILKRGYAFVKKDGVLVSSTTELCPEDRIETVFHDFVLYSKVVEKK
ncbi:exodeoxyribonuclease VII large subunit [Halosquirtibacter xylanolyticus]|uniref:exodeoxyribonuclease VII large subunit n=1 Tax=Halosquirtibacter xylanolyticus TaxID=3374599 RepID=UPI00374A8F26|nr:exodeoxyribonuclease VII large subunit [Prolixibacteraceae bacterium]